MWLAVLGPLSVREQGAVITVPAAKQRALLATLLVHANHLVSSGDIAETVWDGAQPAGARGTVRTYVMRLRQALGPAIGGRVVTRDPGYMIELADDELDLLRFASLVRQGGTALRAGMWQGASEMLTEALALWRGTPLADIPSQVLHRDAVPRLEQLRLQAAEWRNEANLKLGRHRELVPELQALATAHPLHERFHAQLMLSLCSPNARPRRSPRITERAGC